MIDRNQFLTYGNAVASLYRHCATEPGNEFEAQAVIDQDRRWLQHTNPGMGALTAHVRASDRAEAAAPEEHGENPKGFFGWLLG